MGLKIPPPQFSTTNANISQHKGQGHGQCNASSSLHSCHVLKPAQTDLVLFKATLSKLPKLPQLLLLANLLSFYCIDVGI